MQTICHKIGTVLERTLKSKFSDMGNLIIFVFEIIRTIMFYR